ncbi:MAG TPA: hypothetical protein VG674_25030, partial [Amycolatopsis sp.]|nr:hypothetical protein [Amycolatopsis sp.]
MHIKKTPAVLSLIVAAGLAATVGTATAAVQHQKHGLGLNVAALRAAQSRSHVHPTAQPVHPLGAAAAPPSADLTHYANVPGDQGQVGSCVTWATGYTGYGVLMNEQGITGGPMAPMFIYSQIAKGNDQGTDAGVALPMEQQQGIDTKTDYTQGDTDFTTQPTQAERDNACPGRECGNPGLTWAIVTPDDQQACLVVWSIGSLSTYCPGLPCSLGH